MYIAHNVDGKRAESEAQIKALVHSYSTN